MARTRTTKKLAQRIDLNYFKRPTSLKRAKLWLTILVPAIALAWIGWLVFAKDSRVYSSGRMSEAHAVLANDCVACHVQKAGAFEEKAEDGACLACHDGPIHHHVAVKQVSCAECHSEHRGRVDLLATSNENCAQCHSDLKASGGTSSFANAIHSFADGHPEFAILRTSGGAPLDRGTIKLNHALHMKSIRRGPTGPMVQLECGNCHRPTAAPTDLTYGDAKYRDAITTYKAGDELLPVAGEALPLRNASSGRELMAPVKFATACASCHLLTFDKRFDDGVPHDKPEVVHAFLVKKFQDYIATHPSEVRGVREPDRDLTGKPLLPAIVVSTPAQWVAWHTAQAELLLWRKTCRQCHELSGFVSPSEGQGKLGAGPLPSATIFANTLMSAGSGKPLSTAGLPQIAPANTIARWMPHARFDHQAHEGFTCASCHQKALTSALATDVLMPGIATCQTCHAPGSHHAESRCFECHGYHDWSKRKEISPKFTLPGIELRGR